MTHFNCTQKELHRHLPDKIRLDLGNQCRRVPFGSNAAHALSAKTTLHKLSSEQSASL